MIQKLTITAAALLSFGLAGNAFACSCSFIPLQDESVAQAKSVFVLLLESATLRPADGDPPSSHSVQAKIQVVETLRGKSNFTGMEYSTEWCCGTEPGSEHAGH